MCHPTYPVFRSASILKCDPPITSAITAEIGVALRDSSGPFTKDIIRLISSLRNVTRAAEGGDALRVRLTPAVTIDFPPIEFTWRANDMEFRACFTVPSSANRKAKVWTRYNFKSIQTDKKTVATFYGWVEEINSFVHDECLKFYNARLAALGLEPRLSKTYDIVIRMVSAANAEIKSELDREFAQPHSSKTIASRAYELLIDEVGRDSGLPIPRKELSERTRLVGFRYPRNRLLEPAPIGSSIRGEADDKVSPVPVVQSPPLAEDNFEALCLVDYNQNSLDITGVAHEVIPPKDFRRSAPHVVTGEISFEVGNAY